MIAVSNDDYSESSSLLEFPGGSMNGDRVCLVITINDDSKFEGDETFSVRATLITADGLSLILGESTVTIQDNEGS